MARPFLSIEAENIIKRYQDLLSDLGKTVELFGFYRQKIWGAANLLAEQETLKVLQKVPVEELNTIKGGIRTKTLRDNNFCTMADFYTTSVHNIASIHGISQDAAYTIKRITDGIIEKTKKEVKVKLNIDNKTKEASKLVTEIFIYKTSLPLIEACHEFIHHHQREIEYSVANLKPFTKSLKWFFASKIKKSLALQAFSSLSKLEDSEYLRQLKANLYEINKIGRSQSIDAWEDFSKNPSVYISLLEEITPGLLGIDDPIYGLPEDLSREIQEQSFFPEGLLCNLRRYQEWGVKYILHQENVLLGDEMGLGKTIQAIAAMVSLRNTGATHFMVVCPASIVTNWCREITKHSLLRATKIHGNDRKQALKSWVSGGGVAVTTYETTKHLLLIPTFKFSLLIVDEAHFIKNPEAQRTVNTLSLGEHAERKLFMTGTALENRVDEMITLMGMLQPRIATQVQNIAYMSSAPLFRERIAPVYYRRKREDVLTELPELIINEEFCSMSTIEESIYEEAVLSKQYSKARQVSWTCDDLNDSSKANRLREIVEQAEAEDRKVIVFSFFLETIRKVSEFLGDRCMNPINGSVSPQRRQEIIDEFDEAPPGAVLVAQIQSGGTGLNIQAATVVVICEPQFKPSIENQAISRAYRMNQTRNVLVYRLLCENTVDEKITEMLKQKQAVFDAFADSSSAADHTVKVDNNTFGNIIKDEIDRINEKREGTMIRYFLDDLSPKET